MSIRSIRLEKSFGDVFTFADEEIAIFSKTTINIFHNFIQPKTLLVDHKKSFMAYQEKKTSTKKLSIIVKILINDKY